MNVMDGHQTTKRQHFHIASSSKNLQMPYYKCCTLHGSLYNTVSVELTFQYSALITFEYSVFLPITLHFVESLCTHGRAIRKCAVLIAVTHSYFHVQ